MKRDISLASEGIKGDLRVFASVTASYSVLSAMWPTFQQAYPLVELKLVAGDQAAAIPQVAQGAAEVAIAAKPDQLSKGLVFKTLSYSSLRFIMPASGLVAQQVLQMMQQGLLKPELLPIIMPDKGLTRSRVEQWFQAKGEILVYLP